jgi:hypothetical protein
MIETVLSGTSRRGERNVPATQRSHQPEVLVVSQNTGNSDSEIFSQGITGDRAGLGIMVFSSACKMLYANQAAYYFLKTLNRRENGHATVGALPSSMTDLFDRIVKSLESRIANGTCEQVEARRRLEGENEPILLQAFGLPDQQGMQRARIVMTIQGGVRSSGPSSGPEIS